IQKALALDVPAGAQVINIARKPILKLFHVLANGVERTRIDALIRSLFNNHRQVFLELLAFFIVLGSLQGLRPFQIPEILEKPDIPASAVGPHIYLAKGRFIERNTGTASPAG